MKPSQPQLPTMPRDFSQPVECRGSELVRVIAEARAQGFHGHLMRVKSKATYQLKFFRLPSAAKAGKTFKETVTTTAKARRIAIPGSPAETQFLTVSVSHANQS